SASLDHGAMTINQFDIHLPGDTALSAFGVLSPTIAKSLRFEGSFDAAGKSFRELLTVLDASALELPAEQLGEFSIHSNIYLAPDQIRFSESDVKINGLQLGGGLVGYYE